jgi:hypothetical protein
MARALRRRATALAVLGFLGSVCAGPAGAGAAAGRPDGMRMLPAVHEEPIVERPRSEPGIESAIREVLCQEARTALRGGALGREVLAWLLTEGHHCRDQALLFDAFGF